MKKAIFLVGLSLMLLLNVSFGQSKDNWKMKFDLFQNHGELYFRFEKPSQNMLNNLASIIPIDRTANPSWIYAYASKKQFKEFLESGLSYEPLQHPSTLIRPRMMDQVDLKQSLDWDFYPTYEAYVDLMVQFAADYPDLCKIVNIGQSENGRDLLFAVISDNIGQEEEGEPQVMYTSSMHGDEITAYVLCLRLIDYLLSQYASKDDIQTLVNNTEIWINPLANPDGTYASGNSTVSGATRNNANLVNLNRNYPDPEDGLHPDGNVYQKETMAFMALAEAQHFVLSCNFHGGAEVCNYPWDTWPNLHADDDWWQMIAHEYADTAQANSPAGYMSGFDDGITNGYQWYTISGGRQDYMNYYRHCRELTIEISTVKLVPASQLPDYWEYSYRSLLNYLKQGMYGIQGQVSDSLSGAAITASVFVENHDMDNSWVASNSVGGWYFRPIMDGTYDLTFFAPGYAPKTIGDIEAVSGGATFLNVQLSPTESGVDELLPKAFFIVGPNPFEGNLCIHYLEKDDAVFQIEVFTASGTQLVQKAINGRQLQEGYQLHLENTPTGILFMKISRDGQKQVWKLISK